MRVFFLTILCLFAAVFSACDDNRVYEKNVPVKGNSWDVNQKAVFDFSVADTVNPHLFFLNIRHGANYPFSNMFLFLNTYYPDSTLSRDTIEFFLADPSGQWTGKGGGELFENTILFKRGVVFPDSGKYRIEIEQGMRTAKLKDVYDVGLRIEKQQ